MTPSEERDLIKLFNEDLDIILDAYKQEKLYDEPEFTVVDENGAEVSLDDVSDE